MKLLKLVSGKGVDHGNIDIMLIPGSFQSAKSIYLFLYQGSGWIGISIIGLAVLKRIVNLIRGAHGK